MIKGLFRIKASINWKDLPKNLNYHSIIMSDKINNMIEENHLPSKILTSYRSKEERKASLKQRRQERKALKQVGFHDKNLEETQYYFENGFRKVYPYFFRWNTTAKERWLILY